ncbi:hypothetical protein SeMB42_g06895 [Synchytrium endobioticum]|uniref:Fe2OG dioxygenase domain-containing protein n=1 Tax=Synchytrium endobioticum TaxID=286115 RepID=A0A507CJ18_9FUNG|nr:hypothetical protein SeMB42_g06895 [Synchytrium endobioticum]
MGACASPSLHPVVDYGCLTILNTDDTTGALQVLGKDGVWLAADPVPGCFVINIGDMLRNLTNGLYQSTLHRVIHTKGSYRVSVPFFFEPAFDAVISPIPELVDETGGIPHHKPVMGLFMGADAFVANCIGHCFAPPERLFAPLFSNDPASLGDSSKGNPKEGRLGRQQGDGGALSNKNLLNTNYKRDGPKNGKTQSTC